MADLLIDNIGESDDIETALIRLKKTLSVMLSSLDSQNIKTLKTDKTVISSSDGNTIIDGTKIIMKDICGVTRIEMGADKDKFVFKIKNKMGFDSVSLQDSGDAKFSGDIETEKNASVGNNLYIGATQNSCGTKVLQFYDDNIDDAKKAKIIATKATNQIVSLKIVANKIILSTLEGVYDNMGNRFISTSERDAYVTVNGIDYPVEFK